MSGSDRAGPGDDMHDRILTAMAEAVGPIDDDSDDDKPAEVCELVERRRPGRPRKNPPATPATVSSIADARRPAKPDQAAPADELPAEKPKKFARVPKDCSPLDYLEGVFRGKYEGNILRVRAAIAAAQYRHVRQGDGGKKEERQRAAEAATTHGGRFTPGQAPGRVRFND